MMSVTLRRENFSLRLFIFNVDFGQLNDFIQMDETSYSLANVGQANVTL